MDRDGSHYLVFCDECGEATCAGCANHHVFGLCSDSYRSKPDTGEVPWDDFEHEHPDEHKHVIGGARGDE